MFRIIKSLLVIVAVGAIAAGSTGAYFSDQETIAGNVFATGTLNLTVNHSAGKPFSIQNAYPGYVSEWEHMDLFNEGSLPFETFIRLTKDAGTDDALYNVARIEMYDSGWDSICGNGDDALIWDDTLQQLTTHYTRASDNDPNSVGTPGNDDVRPGWSQRVCQRVSLPSSLDNSYMGMTANFTEVIDAKQNDD